MGLIVKESTGSKFEIIPEGTYTAICYGLIDEGEQYSQRYDKWAEKVRIMWEIPELLINIDGENLPRAISKDYTASLGEKSNLRRDLVSWRGKQFTQEELAGFDLENILGAPCLLQIIHGTKSNGDKYASVSSVMRLPKSMTAPNQVNKSVLFNCDEKDFSEKLLKLPEWLQNIIRQSKQYQNFLGFQAEGKSPLELGPDEKLPWDL